MTANRVEFLFGALLTGVLVTAWGYQLTIGTAAIAFTAADLIVLLSPLRDARHEDPDIVPGPDQDAMNGTPH
jgi:predicted MFS family arabinose efflux permease